MGTRPCLIDTGAVLYLMGEKGMDPASVRHFLYHDCGLKGQQRHARAKLEASADPRATFAIASSMRERQLCYARNIERFSTQLH
jgi:acetate kinase